MTQEKKKSNESMGGVGTLVTVILALTGIAFAAGAAVKTGADNKKSIAQERECAIVERRENRLEAQAARLRIEDEADEAARVRAELTRKLSRFEGVISEKLDSQGSRIDMIFDIVSQMELASKE